MPHNIIKLLQGIRPGPWDDFAEEFARQLECQAIVDLRQEEPELSGARTSKHRENPTPEEFVLQFVKCNV
jgi:hypothetical protein